MRTRAVGAARRLIGSRHGAVVLSALARPYRLRGRGVNPVVADHYGLQVGRSFTDDTAAARHYFAEGWKLGVVPNPFVDVPAARFSRLVALRLRNALARIGSGGHTDSILAPSRFLPDDFAAELLAGDGGWLPELMRRVRADPQSVPVVIGLQETTWTRYVERCREVSGAARVVHEERLLDLPFYSSQLGGSRFLTAEAAFDDYLANGEFDGRTPHPFFEAEWYEASDRSQVRRGRPVNQLLDFVARGELGQAGPHFWGQRYLDELGGQTRPVSLLGHFTKHASAAGLTPAANGVEPVTRAVAEQLSRDRVARYHTDLARLEAVGPLLDRHRRVEAPAVQDGTCLVIVDERHVATDEACGALAAVLEQRLRGVRIAVIEGDDAAHPATLDEIASSDAALEIVQRQDDEPMGATARRLIEQIAPDGWAVWTPTQRWEREFLDTAVGALRAEPDVSTAAVLSDGTPPAWLRTTDAVWLDGLDGAGVVFRGSGDGALLPCAELDVGLAAHLLIGLAPHHRSAVIQRPLVRVLAENEIDEVERFDRRSAHNAARARHLLAFAEPVAEVGIAIPTYEDWQLTVTAVRAVLGTTRGHDVRVVIVDNGSRRPVASILAACFAADDRVMVQRMCRNTDFALGSNLAAAEAGGRVTVFLNNDTAAQPGWLEPLIAAIEDGAAAAQPLLLYGDRTVQTAGTVFFGGLSMPRHLLAGTHVPDVGESIDGYDFAALTAACLAVPYEPLAAIGGFDPRYVNGMEDVDFCFRLKDHTEAPLRVRTASRVVHFESRSIGRSDFHDANRARFASRWRRRLAALDDRAIFDDGPVELADVVWSRFSSSPLWTALPVLRSRRPRPQVNEPEPRLRWAIKSSATGDLAGDRWGDTYFAEALANALRRLGQDVVIDRVTSHARESAVWDDVTLSLRGLTQFVPQPGAVNVLWVISHPELVSRHELCSGFQRIYAAGAEWARRVNQRWGLEVEPLLQATDTTKFHLGVDRGADRRGIVFIGRTRGVPRVIVRDVIAAGGEPNVYGDDGWEQFIDPRFVKGMAVENDDVPNIYGSAAIVLNDHWRDMAKNGFFSNRLFDAAATGARIISDPVPGVEGIFGRQVQCYDDQTRLRELLDPHSSHWPDRDELRRLASRVAAEHSFDARARILLNDVLEVRRKKSWHA